jgi:phosphatidylinositol glycan class B
MSSPSLRRLLLSVGGVALALRLYVAFRYRSLAWPDEVFQTLEQAHRLAFGYGLTPWEWREGIRSWAVPGVLAAVMKVTAPFGPGSSGYLGGVNVFLAALGTLPALAAAAWAHREKLRWPWAAGLACALWFELVYLSTRALTEAFAAWLLVPAFFFAARLSADAPPREWVKVGALFGAVVGLRFHLGPAVALGLLAFTGRKPRSVLAAAAGGTAVVLAFGALDWVTLGTPFQSIWKNYVINVVQKKSEFFGTSAPSEYVASLAEVWSLGALPLLGLSVFAWKRWPALLLTCVAILGSHTALAHKEYRFLLPMLALLALSAGLGLSLLAERSERAAVVAGLLLLGASMWRGSAYDWKNLAPRGPESGSLWTFREGRVRAMASLSTDDSVCGVASLGSHWAWTAGMTYLHRDVPYFAACPGWDLRRAGNAFNTVVAPEGYARGLGSFQKKGCFDGTCVFQRPGPCEPGDYQVNRWLAEVCRE